MDYKSVFTNLCLELQQNRSWIKGLRKNPFTHSLTTVPFVRGHRSVFPRTPRNTGVYTRHPTFVTATSGVLTRLPAWLSKNRMRVYTLSDLWSEKKIACIHGLRSEGVKPHLRVLWTHMHRLHTWMPTVFVEPPLPPNLPSSNQEYKWVPWGRGEWGENHWVWTYPLFREIKKSPKLQSYI